VTPPNYDQISKFQEYCIFKSWTSLLDHSRTMVHEHTRTDHLTITKLEAARRQLGTAIVLWFNDDDPVSIHTLVCAAYEIVHTLTKKRNPLRPKLIFDSLAITENERKEFVIN
jgi:hypothetical protein